MPKQHINPDTLMKLPSYSQVVVTSGGRTVYIAGQGAFDTGMQLVGANDYYAQTVKALQNLAAALEAAGARVTGMWSADDVRKESGPGSAGAVRTRPERRDSVARPFRRTLRRWSACNRWPIRKCWSRYRQSRWWIDRDEDGTLPVRQRINHDDTRCGAVTMAPPVTARG